MKNIIISPWCIGCCIIVTVIVHYAFM